MNLITLKREEISCLISIITNRLKEANLTESSDILRTIEFIQGGYDCRFMGAYVDSIEDPKIALVLTHYPDIFSYTTTCSIALIYVAPELRGKPNNFSELIRISKNYARLNNAKRLIGSSWVFRNAPSISKLFEKEGFEIQEVTYTINV